MTTKGNLNVSGAATITGGVYEKVTISGASKINGDIEAQKISLSGASKIEGNVTAGGISASGASKINGDVKADQFTCSGATKVSGGVKADTFKASGASKIGGDVKADTVKMSGASKIAGDVAAEHFKASGSFGIGGLINADKVEISLGGRSEVAEIGGEKITVIWCGDSGGLRGGVVTVSWCSDDVGLTAGSIEGDDVHLEATSAAVVRGRRVKVGSGCRIDRVEYSESLQIDPDAKVDAYEYTGEGGSPPAVTTDPVMPPPGWKRRAHGGRAHRGLRVAIGPWEVRDPVLRAIVGILGVLLAGVAVVAAALIVAPVVAIILCVVLGLVALLLLGLAIGIPVLVAVAVVAKLLLLPFYLIRAIFCPRRRWSGWW